jgi:cell division protein FtsI/penicillin-binding protein 2
MILVGVYDVLLLGRLTDIQGIQASFLKMKADQIHFRGVPLAPFRGNIVDRHGVLLAGSQHAYSVYAIPVQTRRRRSEEVILLATLLQMETRHLAEKTAAPPRVCVGEEETATGATGSHEIANGCFAWYLSINGNRTVLSSRGISRTSTGFLRY